MMEKLTRERWDRPSKISYRKGYHPKSKRRPNHLGTILLWMVAAVFWIMGLSVLWNAAKPRRPPMLLNFEPSLSEEGDYVPSNLERYILENASTFRLDTESVSGCHLWQASTLFGKEEADKVPEEIRVAYELYVDKLSTYYKMAETSKVNCDSVPNLLDYFDRSELSHLPGSGFLEPLLPPLRHPGICDQSATESDTRFLVHDFVHICRQSKSRKVVLLDMGASWEYEQTTPPILELIALYENFGITFDHIYGFEQAQENPHDVYDKIPPRLLPVYHWFNVGVDDTNRNPLKLLEGHFDENDYVIVKLGLDDTTLEQRFVERMLQSNLIDAVYYAPHVEMSEMTANDKKKQRQGTILESLELFSKLRKAGIASHYWVG